MSFLLFYWKPHPFLVFASIPDQLHLRFFGGTINEKKSIWTCRGLLWTYSNAFDEPSECHTGCILGGHITLAQKQNIQRPRAASFSLALTWKKLMNRLFRAILEFSNASGGFSSVMAIFALYSKHSVQDKLWCTLALWNASLSTKKLFQMWSVCNTGSVIINPTKMNSFSTVRFRSWQSVPLLT